MKMSVDGREQSVLHSTSWLHGLTLDYTSQVLYWITSGGQVYSLFVNGSNKTEVYSDGYGYNINYYWYNSLTFLNDQLFWLNHYQMNQLNLKDATTHITSSSAINNNCYYNQFTRPVVAVSKDRQPEGEVCEEFYTIHISMYPHSGEPMWREQWRMQSPVPAECS